MFGAKGIFALATSSSSFVRIIHEVGTGNTCPLECSLTTQQSTHPTIPGTVYLYTYVYIKEIIFSLQEKWKTEQEGGINHGSFCAALGD